MRTLRDHASEPLFDPWEYLGPQRRGLLERSWAGVFRDYLLEHLPVKELAAAFLADFGRPSKDLHVALGALILQQLHDLTDQQAVEAVALNIAWHYALDIRREPDAYLCERTLRNYRRRIIELGLDEALFRTLTDQLIKRVGVDASKQRLDSTTVKSAIRGLTRLGILVEAASKFLRELRRRRPELYAEVEAEIVRKYVERQGDGCFADTRPSESKRRLPAAAQDVYALVQQFRLSEAAGLESFALLERIFHEQCEIVEDASAPAVVRPPCTSGCDGVINPADPDARYNKHRGTGYQVQVMETFAEDDGEEREESAPRKPDLITHVAVNPLTTHDQDALTPALDDAEQRGVKPDELLADSHYGSNACLEKGQERGVKVVSPSMPPKGKQQASSHWRTSSSMARGGCCDVRRGRRRSRRASPRSGCKCCSTWWCAARAPARTLAPLRRSVGQCVVISTPMIASPSVRDDYKTPVTSSSTATGGEPASRRPCRASSTR